MRALEIIADYLMRVSSVLSQIYICLCIFSYKSKTIKSIFNLIHCYFVHSADDIELTNNPILTTRKLSTLSYYSQKMYISANTAVHVSVILIENYLH